MKGTPEERFWAKVKIDPETECWIWIGATSESGGGRFYGYIKVDGKTWLAHRWAYEHFIGPIPDETLDHDANGCPTLCVNPWHLDPCSRGENARRGGNSKKTTCPEGHLYDASYGGDRHCKRCRAATNRRWRARQRDLAVSKVPRRA